MQEVENSWSNYRKYAKKFSNENKKIPLCVLCDEKIRRGIRSGDHGAS
jgi:hypothetical protein